jgi:hypothetical protein
MNRTRAADDYEAIRLRMEELRREQMREPTMAGGDAKGRGPRPYHLATAGKDRSEAGIASRARSSTRAAS